MKGKTLLRKSALVFIALALVFTSVAVSAEPVSAATKTIKSTTYNQVIVSKSTAYCAMGNTIKKVNLNTGKVTTLYKDISEYMECGEMILKGDYLYFTAKCNGVILRRVSVKNKKCVTIDSGLNIRNIGISGKKLYYTADYGAKYPNKKGVKMVASLSGKNMKKTSVKVSEKKLKTNKKGYKVTGKTTGKKTSDDAEQFKYTLVKPGDDISLGTLWLRQMM